MMDHGGLARLVSAGAGYFLGSIPFGLVLTRLAGTADIRAIGSGNIGATNVLRTGRKDLAAATLVLDGLKGTLAVVLARHFAGEAAGLAAAVGAFFGHLYPVWLRFRGGKGVATFLGCLFGVWWPAGAIFSGTWVLVALLSRYSSSAALTASVVAPLVFVPGGEGARAAVFLALAAVLWWKHRTNIARLIAGTESRIGART